MHVTRALEFAHSSGILHLGLRPSKILFNELRRAKVAGLGFDNTTSAAGAQATPDIKTYLAPEQLGAKGDLKAETDIFSLGATFYYMLTGRPPQRDHRQRIPSPKQVNRVIPDPSAASPRRWWRPTRKGVTGPTAHCSTTCAGRSAARRGRMRKTGARSSHMDHWVGIARSPLRPRAGIVRRRQVGVS